MREPIIPERSPDRIAADNRDELDSWIEERAAALVALGASPDEARQRAREEFGDVEGARGYAEGQDRAADRRLRLGFWIEEFVSDMRIAARMLARTPTVAVVVFLTFALGIG